MMRRFGCPGGGIPVTMPKELPFPILKPQELRNMIASFLSVDVHISDLERPAPEVAQRVFEATVRLLVGPNEFDYSSLSWTDFPELYTDAAPRIAFFSRLQKIFGKIMVKDFCFDDLVRPEGARFMAQLSGLMNFLRFRGERLEILQKCAEQQGGISEERRLLEEATRKKRSELARVKELHEAERQQAEAMEPERQKRRQLCVQLSKTHDHLFNQQSGLRSGVNKLKDDLAAATFEFNTKLQERENLEDQIVQSPSKIQARLSSLSQKLTETRDDATKLLSRDTQLAEEVAWILELGKRMEENLESLTQIEKAKASKKEASMKNKERQKECDHARVTYQSIVDDINALGRTYEQASTQRSKAAEELESVQKEMEQAIGVKKAEKVEAETENAHIEATIVAEGRRKMQDWNQKGEEQRERHQYEMQRVSNNCKAAENAFLAWTSRLQEAMKEM